MPDTTNAALAARIRELSAKATAGEWQWEDWQEDGGPNLTTLAAPPTSRPDGPSHMFPTLGQRILSAEDPMENPAGAELIVTLRNNAIVLAEALEREAVLLDACEKLFRQATNYERCDWACIKCRPHSDMLKSGWLCGFHNAEKLLPTLSEKETS